MRIDKEGRDVTGLPGLWSEDDLLVDGNDSQRLKVIWERTVERGYANKEDMSHVLERHQLFSFCLAAVLDCDPRDMIARLEAGEVTPDMFEQAVRKLIQAEAGADTKTYCIPVRPGQ